MGQQFILEHCGKVAGCKPNPAPDFCRGSCIPKQYANNGIEECVDGSDEGTIGMKKNVYLQVCKSFSEALILASTNPQYDKRLFIDLPVQYMKTTSLEHVVYINCSEYQNRKQFV